MLHLYHPTMSVTMILHSSQQTQNHITWKLGENVAIHVLIWNGKIEDFWRIFLRNLHLLTNKKWHFWRQIRRSQIVVLTWNVVHLTSVHSWPCSALSWWWCLVWSWYLNDHKTKQIIVIIRTVTDAGGGCWCQQFSVKIEIWINKTVVIRSDINSVPVKHWSYWVFISASVVSSKTTGILSLCFLILVKKLNC